ncbi:MAG: hypothetical protein ABJB86_06175 [Bacteroidota bacterium]
MRIFFTLVICLLAGTAFCQDLTGIWRGSFISADNKMNDLFNLEDRYKYEVQIDQHGKEFTGVTYSYKTTVFYGKASSNGTINPETGKVVLNELKLLELKMADHGYACWMICFLQYKKNGDEEFLEGRYSSYRESDSAACGRGNVSLRKVVTSDFYREPFLAKREKEKRDSVAKNTSKPTAGTNTAKLTKPVITTKTARVAAAKKPVTTAAPVAKNKPGTKTNSRVAKSHPSATKKPLAKGNKTNPAAITKTDTNNKSSEVTSDIESDKKLPVIKMKEPSMIPTVLKNRENEVVQTLVVNTNEITINIYDNGTIDHDTISVYLDKKLVINHRMLTTEAIVLKFKMDENTDYHELVMVADNLGDIPPNTSLMVVKAGDKQYEVRIASTEQKNAVVIFKYEKPK